jgi:hypothetical protein
MTFTPLERNVSRGEPVASYSRAPDPSKRKTTSPSRRKMPIDGLRADRLDTVGEELVCAFALAGP